MTEEKDNDNTDLVRPDNRGLATRSANLIRRGLNRLDKESSDSSTIESMPSGGRASEFDEKAYPQAKLYFEAALEQFTGDKDVRKWEVTALLKRLVDDYGYPSKKFWEMTPYMEHFIEEYYFGDSISKEVSPFFRRLRSAIDWQFMKKYLADHLQRQKDSE